MTVDYTKPPYYQDHIGISDATFNEVKQRCLKARELSYSPYSKFRVGCTLLTEDGTLIDGANVENASYGALICAERTTITKLVSMGHTKFQLIAISSDLDEVISPCGICRQVIREFTYQLDLQLPIYMFNKDGSSYIKMFLRDILPLSFGPEQLSA